MESAHSMEQTKEKIPGLVGTSVGFLITTWATTIVRFYVRRRMVHLSGWDDYFMLIASVWITVYAGSLLKIASLIGNGSLETWPGLVDSSRWVLVCEATYLQTVLFLKLSLGVFFLRIVTKKWQKRLVWGIMGFSTTVNISDSFFVIFMCGNPTGFLQRYITGQCTSHTVNMGILFTHAATTTVTDLILAVLPIFILWNVQMNTRKKVSVGLILSLGLIGTVCSAVRFNFIEGLLSIDDFFWSASSAAVWSMIEPGTGIIAANLATMRPLFKRFLDGVKTVTRNSMVTTKRMSHHFKHSVDESFLNASLKSGLDPQRSSLVPPEKCASPMGVTTTCVGGPILTGDVGERPGFGRKIYSALGSIRRPEAARLGRALSSAIGSIIRRGDRDKITVGLATDPENYAGTVAGNQYRPWSLESGIQKDVDVDITEEGRRRSSVSSGPTLVENRYYFQKRPSQDSHEGTLLPSYRNSNERRVTFLDNPTPEARTPERRDSTSTDGSHDRNFRQYNTRSFM